MDRRNLRYGKKAALILIMLTTMLLFAACTSETPEAVPATEVPATEAVVAAEATEAPAATESGSLSVETAYGDLKFPEETGAQLQHREVSEDGVVMEIFSMLYKETEMELFRIYYGDAGEANIIGMLKTENGDIPVAVTVCEYAEEDFADADTQEQYNVMMEGLESVIKSIWDDSRFMEPQDVVVKEVEKQLKLWNVQLPENMEWEETTGENSYQVVFYGNANGERRKYYAVAIGEPTLETVLGSYQYEDTALVVSVESYDLPDPDGWPENAIAEMYMTMGSINDVIQAIMESEDFTEQIPETP